VGSTGDGARSKLSSVFCAFRSFCSSSREKSEGLFIVASISFLFRELLSLPSYSRPPLTALCRSRRCCRRLHAKNRGRDVEQEDKEETSGRKRGCSSPLRLELLAALYQHVKTSHRVGSATTTRLSRPPPSSSLSRRRLVLVSPSAMGKLVTISGSKYGLSGRVRG
jgi:hypothetical protein